MFLLIGLFFYHYIQVPSLFSFCFTTPYNFRQFFQAWRAWLVNFLLAIIKQGLGNAAELLGKADAFGAGLRGAECVFWLGCGYTLPETNMTPKNTTLEKK